MSVIRSSSNPEKLYIYGTQDYFYFDRDKKISIEDTYDFFEKYISSDFYMIDEGKSEYKGISVWADWVEDNGKNEFKTHFKHEDWDEPLIMWDVTWEYIVNDFRRRLKL